MFLAFLFILELVALFFLSQELTKHFSSLLLRITKNQKTTIYIMSFFFFPGVFIHEFAHLILANILFVRTGDIEFFPQIIEDRVKLGSVAIAKSDPFRRFIIGVAPIIFGLAIMLGIFYYLSPFFPGINWQTLVLAYLFFEISNTMFSSKKDMEGSIVLLIAVVLFSIAFYVIGFRVNINFEQLLNNGFFQFFLKQIDILFLIPILTDAISIGTMRLVSRRL